jgi:hypothetical protein
LLFGNVQSTSFGKNSRFFAAFRFWPRSCIGFVVPGPRTTRTLTMLRGMLLIVGSLLLPVGVHAAEATVAVQLTSGRSFTGTLDSRTDDQRLWLRWRIGDVELQRPIGWERIEKAELNGDAIELAELQARAADLATPGRITPLRTLPDNDRSRPEPRPAAPIVHSVRCDAWLANWDADANFDGLLVQIEAQDQNGQTLLVQGTVEAELVTIDYQPAYLNSTSGGRVPTSLGRWTQLWDSRQNLRLELQGRDPQRDGSLSRYGLLKVRVTIPGSGVFEQQLDGLRMRPFMPVQNSLWR